MIVAVMTISFILDSIISILVSNNSIFLPVFSIVSLAVCYPYFNNNNYRFFKYSAVMGLFYDVVYTNTLFMNFFVFMIVAFSIIFISYLLSNNIYVTILLTISSIIIYRVISYLLLVISNHTSFSISILFRSIYSSLLINIIYGFLLYFLVHLYAKRHKIIKSK